MAQVLLFSKNTRHITDLRPYERGNIPFPTRAVMFVRIAVRPNPRRAALLVWTWHDYHTNYEHLGRRELARAANPGRRAQAADDSGAVEGPGSGAAQNTSRARAGCEWAVQTVSSQLDRYRITAAELAGLRASDSCNALRILPLQGGGRFDMRWMFDLVDGLVSRAWSRGRIRGRKAGLDQVGACRGYGPCS